MTRPRSELIVLESTPYYHCVARCVRRAFLCGTDAYSGRCFDHRKTWLTARMRRLEQVFAIDIAAYAVMSNHYHLVLHVDRHSSQFWSREEVIQRWLRLYKGPPLIQRYQRGESLLAAELAQVDTLVALWRERLCSISWFMACLNEYMARRANQEDDCKGRFWEGRFTSQALLDEAALLSCMAYVDLNPVRARMADNLAHSAFTSVQQRLHHVQRKLRLRRRPTLMPFADSDAHGRAEAHIPFRLPAYIELVEWTGSSIRPDKRGHMTAPPSKALETLMLSPEQWRILVLRVQKQAIVMLNGLAVIARLAHKSRQRAA